MARHRTEIIGFEPIPQESNSCVLPLHHIPRPFPVGANYYANTHQRRKNEKRYVIGFFVFLEFLKLT